MRGYETSLSKGRSHSASSTPAALAAPSPSSSSSSSGASWWDWAWGTNATSTGGSIGRSDTEVGEGGWEIDSNVDGASYKTPPIHIVAIVGAAHVPGIAREWTKLQAEVPVGSVNPIDWKTMASTANSSDGRTDGRTNAHTQRCTYMRPLSVSVCLCLSRSYTRITFSCLHSYAYHLQLSPPQSVLIGHWH